MAMSLSEAGHASGKAAMFMAHLRRARIAAPPAAGLLAAAGEGAAGSAAIGSFSCATSLGAAAVEDDTGLPRAAA